jgi:threonine/homoserine/homoserine lactone efflux protein
MDLIALMPAFVVAVLFISASPGPAMALVVRRAAVRGWQAAVPTVLGVEFGLYLWALMAAAGFAALVAVSQTAFLVLKIVGAAVLVWMGLRAWRSAWGGADPAKDDSAADHLGGRRAFAEGVVVQLAHPKLALFMVAFYPQFVPADRPLFATTAGLALVQVRRPFTPDSRTSSRAPARPSAARA